MIKVKFNEKEREVEDNITYYELSKAYELETGEKPYLAKVNGEIKELRRHAKDGEDIEFLLYDNDAVKAAYARTATLILLKAISKVYGKTTDAGIRFRIKDAYYFEIEGEDIPFAKVEEISKEFKNIVNEAVVIKKITHSKTEVMKMVNTPDTEDVKLLFTYSYRPKINLRYIDNYVRYINGELLHDTSYVNRYRIQKYNKGLIIILPSASDKKVLEDCDIGEKSFSVLDESSRWAKKLGVNTVGRLNDYIAKGKFDDLVIMSESFQEKRIGDIAEIVKNSKKRLVFIAGPSCSGKTSFSHRLMYHLRALDLNPYPIACDNFFKERSETPRDENGEYDFEIIDAMDIRLLNNTLNSLLRGDETIMPTFNFATGKKEYRGNNLTIKENDVLILEGIHCLNPNLVPSIDQENIFKIYISALTEVCIDNANRIATSDLRLIRRIVRDRRTRGIGTKESLKRWKSVRIGEEKSIFPYQEEADFYFNSALIYEFNVLKNQALASLYGLSEDEEVGSIARRLIKVLSFFLGVDTEAIPKYSLVREFIGESILEVG